MFEPDLVGCAERHIVAPITINLDEAASRPAHVRERLGKTEA